MKFSRNNKVFVMSLIIAIIIASTGIIFPEFSENIAGIAFTFLIQRFGWLYLLSVTIFLLFCIYLLFSPYRHIKLGPDDSLPEFSRLSWFAMLFSAGMAIGLIFWGVAEPLSHYLNPPHGLADPQSQKAVITSLRYSFFTGDFMHGQTMLYLP